MKKNKKTIVAIIVCYLMLLIPGLVVSYIGDSSGIVISTQKVSTQQVPLGIQDFMDKGDITIILYNDFFSRTKSVIITSDNLQFNEGELIKIKDISARISIDSKDFLPSIVQAFNTLVIRKPEKVGYIAGFINNIPSSFLKNILISISLLTFYLGGFFLMMVISFYYRNSLNIWTIPGMFSCYSFQFFLAGNLADMNQIGFDPLTRMFGYFFIFSIPITILMYRYEETPKGKIKIIRLYEANRRVMQSLWNDFKRFLGIHREQK